MVKPCPEPSCSSSNDAFTKSLAFAMKGQTNGGGGKEKQGGSKSSSSSSKSSPSTTSSSSTTTTTTTENEIPCPLNREALGFFSWSILHTIGAYYPITPTPEEKEAAKNLIVSFAKLYPCLHCRDDFVEAVKQRPPVVTSRDDFSVYLCSLHNEVNVKIGKPVVPCVATELYQRWRTGVGDGCKGISNSGGETASESLGHD